MSFGILEIWKIGILEMSAQNISKGHGDESLLLRILARDREDEEDKSKRKGLFRRSKKETLNSMSPTPCSRCR